MDNQDKNIPEVRSGNSQIDEQIRTTRQALNIEAIAAPYLKQEKKPYDYGSEFGFGSARVPMIRRFLWLNLKLFALYIAKCFNWLFHSRSAKT